MIIATVQGKNAQKDQITAKDGILLSKDDEQIAINMLIKALDDAKITYRKKQEIRRVGRDKFVAFLEHKDKDDIGRVRVAMVMWDKNSNQEALIKTLEVMGLGVKDFNSLLQSYKKTKNIIIGGVVVAILVMGVVILKAKI